MLVKLLLENLLANLGTTIQSFKLVTPIEQFSFRFGLDHCFTGLSSDVLDGLRLGYVLKTKSMYF